MKSGWNIGKLRIRTSPVSRAVRWLKSITRSETHTAPTLITATKQGVHETPTTTLTDQEKQSLAILPFRNLSNDPAWIFYEFSLADAVITELAAHLGNAINGFLFGFEVK